jgi:acetyltransferase-like isoleucine patch superfamily enzyme
LSSDVLRALFWRFRDARPERLLFGARRAVLIARIRLLALWHRAEVEIDISTDVRLGHDISAIVMPRTTNLLRIAPGNQVGDRVLFRLDGGEILIGPGCDLRRDTVLNVAGRLELIGRNIFSWGCAVHCSESVIFEPLASAAEHVTVADSSHYFTDPETFFYDNTRSAPIRIGGNTWLCPKATVTSGVTIGSHCIIGSNSVVTRDVPEGHLASGIPATSRPLDLPWRDATATD